MKKPFKRYYRKYQNNNGNIEIINDMAVICPDCRKEILNSSMDKNNYICSHCGYYFSLTPKKRIRLIVDKDSFIELDYKGNSRDPLKFQGYEEKIHKARGITNTYDAIVIGTARIKGMPCVLGVLDSRFIMGSMGTIVGEIIKNAATVACDKKIPFIIYTASGGARLQEGVFSLMQMTKTVAAFEMMNQNNILSIVVMTNPTTGGVSASFASLGDITLAEPNAIIGFAGKKVIKNTIKEDLPEGFQTSEFLFEHGHIDAIVKRNDQRDYLAKVLEFACENVNINKETNLDKYRKKIMGRIQNVDLIKTLELVRKEKRPTSLDYIEGLVDNFVEIRGDKIYKDDRAMIAGLGTFKGQSVVVIGHQRGRNLEENLKNNFGMPHPSGFHKAIRAIKLADKMKVPIITFVDTKGADPSANSEATNQSYAIAKCIETMISASVPIISIIIGEGGSGGALALASANVILMLENSIFSVISPEGAATILWKDATKVENAMAALKITSWDLKQFGIVDEIIPEIEADASVNKKAQILIIDKYISAYLSKLNKCSRDELLKQRINKYNCIV